MQLNIFDTIYIYKYICVCNEKYDAENMILITIKMLVVSDGI
jgi:hypothetical protein